MLRPPLQWAFRKLGARYPRVLVFLQLQTSHVVVFAGVLLLALYVHLSTGQFWRIVAVSQALVVLDTWLSFAVIAKLLRPADPWLRGDREPESALRAWRALAGLPRNYLGYGRRLPSVFNVVPISVFITIELGRSFVPTLVVITAAATVVFAYGVFLRFYALELIVRPVLEAVSQDVPRDADLDAPSIPLRWRLLVALPTINVITGVVVTGFASPHQGIGALGLGVVVAIGVAFTISLELSVLLLRSIVEPLDDLQRGTDRVAAGELDVRVPVLGSDETGRLANSFNEMVAGLSERERLREAFGAFVDPVLAERVLQEGTVLAGEEVEVSVLFLDIRDFTAFAERASAADVVARLNEFYELIVPILVAHGGHANKFVGDGLLGVFGAPKRLRDHADRAVAAALAIADVVRGRYGEELRIGIGVNSGAVIAGTVGGGGRVEFTVIGDAVNTAARVEEVTRATGDEVLITEGTRALLTRDFGAWTERPPVALKGKRERVGLCAPVASGHAQSALREARADRVRHDQPA
ncbi:MAG TPA: adenylate/guanylate cyclase domain-containing protein [Solirubrobacteraceae bacterium]|nr:adenylate/guanylate cyclase domain-containing protein [Solirubrobacteraceae bacterium]